MVVVGIACFINVEEQQVIVRSLLLALFVLVAPIPLEVLVDEDSFAEGEIILHRMDDVWMQEDWTALESFGYTPLRLVTPSTLIVWKHSEEATYPQSMEGNAPPVDWKSLPEVGQDVRIVFEPNLPEDVLALVQAGVEDLIGTSLFSVQSGFLPSAVFVWESEFMTEWFAEFQGVLWLEPQFETVGRNLESAEKMVGLGQTTHPAAWKVGLNGSNVVIGVADTGIDSDHSCFRNLSDEEIGLEHRKLLHVNTTIDDWDHYGHADYRHGTHTAGILGCHPYAVAMEENGPSAVMTLGYDSQLVVQDIVSEQGWQPPDVDLLLAESALYGGYLHSNSWGDDTTEYTLRSGDFDAFTREFPWTLPLIAPGNNGGPVLEPANARNVIAIGASTKDVETERWMASVHGPTEADTRGIFALAPGVSIVSARSDGDSESYNAGQHTLSGTSMSTPMAATYASVVQQMVQEGWFTGHNETLTEHDLADRAPWFETDPAQGTVLLGDGFVPSAPMMKSLLALSATPLSDTHRNGGEGGAGVPNNYDGWGVLNLSELIDFDALYSLDGKSERPVSNIWVHDSFRLNTDVPSSVLSDRIEEGDPIEYLMNNSWDGSGAIGPFLSTGDVFQQRFILQENESLDVRLSFQAKPEPHLVDDVLLMVRLPDGRFAVGENYRQDGRSMLYYDFANPLNTSAFPATNETTVGIHLDAATLESIEYVDVLVVGRYITPGNQPGTLGIEGDQLGFGLAIRGVEIDPLNHSDADNDGVPYEMDLCPFISALGWDQNKDGCIDDIDMDGVEDDVDSCRSTPQNVPVTGNGCAQQNESPRIFLDELTLQSHNNSSIAVLFSVLDIDSVNVSVSLERVDGLAGTVPVCTRTIQNDSWNTCIVDVQNDFFPLSPGGNWTVEIYAQDLNSSEWTSSLSTTYVSNVFEIHVPSSEMRAEPKSSESWIYVAIGTSLGSAVLLSFVLQRLFSREKR